MLNFGLKYFHPKIEGMKIIENYYTCLLTFTTFTGFKLTNEDSRATSIFTFVFLFNFGTILELLGVNVSNLNKWILVSLFIVLFFIFYKYFSKESRKERIKLQYKNLTKKTKIITNAGAFIYTIFSAILFLKII